MPSKTYPSTERCAYCLNEFELDDLTDEHVIPLALSGRYILEKGACKTCNGGASQRYEQKALNTNFLVPRLLLELKRRRKKSKPPKKLPPISLNASSIADTTFDIDVNYRSTPRSLNGLCYPYRASSSAPIRAQAFLLCAYRSSISVSNFLLSAGQ
ncbi:HNH endonuclease [Paraburkholderia sp. GAS448]|uniref:HNH endonuclease n=1 Tax=Paraburkholderia sp. GAS448 TaxID=3035136 RepID=UPI003D1EF539